ncbi:MAG TPA: tRNA (adenosine(37)-N6)-threonylcarbamoyltransferase complex transferase subunit TsaD [Vicinamibacterales bacterium]|nr:tRNA (adenosine(37)-N6)-threonylcarbamoyltransferase complex transferase subunit TsaD [Vicinamibacterales bacterium]
MSFQHLLAIETSCDETAAAIVDQTDDADRPWAVRSSVVASQVAIHREWGGVVPELASRQHVRDICGVVERALADADLSWSAIDAMAVTQGPGLVGSLLVGVSFAKAAAWSLGRPLVAVHHLAGHIESIWLDHGRIPLPAVVLVVSGGHTNLYLIRREGEYVLLGRTRDDAAGEAYDKVAKLLGLGYPGGPIVDRLAADGNARAIRWPGTRLTNPDRNHPERDGRFDFSFSGLKTAVLRHVRARQAALGQDRLPAAEVRDIAASFQRRVVETLVERTFAAARWYGARAVGVAGGVSANAHLRSEMTARGAAVELPVFIPRLSLSTDNAAMIAAAGLRQLARGRLAPPDLNADASLAL